MEFEYTTAYSSETQMEQHKLLTQTQLLTLLQKCSFILE